MVAYFKQRPETGKSVMTIFYFERFTSILNFKYTSDYSFLDSDGKNLNAKRVPPHPVEHVLDRLAHAVEVARTRAVRFHLLLRVLEHRDEHAHLRWGANFFLTSGYYMS